MGFKVLSHPNHPGVLGPARVYLKHEWTELPFPASLNPEFQLQHKWDESLRILWELGPFNSSFVPIPECFTLNWEFFTNHPNHARNGVGMF